MSSNRRILFLFLLVLAVQECSPAQLTKDTRRVVSLRIALLEIPDSSHTKPTWKPFAALTMLKQAGNGIVYAAGCGAVVGLAGLAIGTSKPVTNKDDYHVLTAMFIGVAVGAAVGVPWGVYNAGESDGGSGTVLGTILGTAGAGLAALLIISGSETVAGRGTGYAFAPFALFLGPILGYHISAKPVYAPQTPDQHTERMVAPMLGQRGGIQCSITF
ncbi:MAG: hypothetical protein WBD36_10090 [Bacteroidota bacterium]